MTAKEEMYQAAVIVYQGLKQLAEETQDETRQHWAASHLTAFEPMKQSVDAYMEGKGQPSLDRNFLVDLSKADLSWADEIGEAISKNVNKLKDFVH